MLTVDLQYLRMNEEGGGEAVKIANCSPNHSQRSQRCVKPSPHKIRQWEA
jgi:hypothetical protein